MTVTLDSLVDNRTCECGCGASLALMRSDARFKSEACKKRHKRGQKTRLPDGRARAKSGKFKKDRSGLQVSYYRSVKVLERFIRAKLGWTDPVAIREEAERVMREALPQRQAARLTARDEARRATGPPNGSGPHGAAQRVSRRVEGRLRGGVR